MDERKIKLIIGTALHDFGKIIHRSGDGRKHALTGNEYLRKHCNIEDKDILDCVKYHHYNDLKSANLENNNLAYISYIADNISSKIDRRKISEEYKFDKDISLSSVFNILNGNNTLLKYEAKYLNHEKGINLPKENVEYDVDYYKKTRDEILDKFNGLYYTKEYLQSLFEILEGYLTYIPSSTDENSLVDISLYDHLKLTSAIASCIYDYCKEKNIEDYSIFLKEANNYYEENMFYLYSLDFSGIQGFIYTIIDSNALKSLRTRSFYLEIMMEDFIDTILDRLGLTRANLLYSGGGHAYLLLANTENTKKIIEKTKYEINEWLIEQFGIELYLSGGGCACSSNELQNETKDSYSNIFKTVSKEISRNKLNRYSKDQIINLNFREDDHRDERECKICKRIDKLKSSNEEGTICSICDRIINFSNNILRSDFFAIELEDSVKKAYSLPLPFNRAIVGYLDEEALRNEMKDNKNFIRAYIKNKSYTGYKMSTKLWVGDYCYDKELKNLISDTDGIKRLGVLRADIDNLGKAFVQGYSDEERSITRSAVFSRNMSLFFKYHINYILENGKYDIYGNCEDPKRRKALIVYSGGDDVFVVGSWRDIIEFSIDLKNYLKQFTIDTLTISAGIGIYAESFPLKAMAEKTGELEEAAKSNKEIINGKTVEKNSVCIFDKDLAFSWNTFEYNIISEKLSLLKRYFDEIDEIGKSLFYKIVQLLKDSDEKINIARLAYLLARLDERIKDKSDKELFSKTIYKWAMNSEDKKQLIAAIYILIYLER